MSDKLSTIIAQSLEPGIDAAVDDLGAVAREIARIQTICSDNPIPVIFITGRADAVRSRMPQHPVLSKPFRMSEVEAAVRDILSQ